MKWKKFKIKTITEAEDIIISTLYDIGLEGAQIEDKVPLTAMEKEQMFVDILPQMQEDDGTAYLSFFVEEAEDGKLLKNGQETDAESILKEVKEVKRARLTEYAKARPNVEYHEGRGVWTVKADLALPCATQNELHLEDAKALVANGVTAVCEGANMPTTLEATKYLQENGVIFAPGKAANAGGVATSALEMSQNSERLSWSFEEVDAKLQNIMINITHNMVDAAKRYGFEGNYVVGANIAGFEKVANAMLAQGVC